MPRSSTRDAGGPLRGLRVLDLTHYLAGPYATKLLGDYGAEVIKVERPPMGDPVRYWEPTYIGPRGRRGSALFSYLNANKASVVLDLKHPAGRAAFLRLAATCDAVVENFMPGVMERLGISYDVLCNVRPDVVLTSISNFGRQGPFRNYEATELNVFALGGRMAASGVKPRPPVRLFDGSSEYMAGTVAASATLIALYGRDRDGVGDHLDVSIANVILGEPDRGLCLYSYSGVNMERPDAPRPFQVFPAADGFVVLNVNRGIERIADMIERPELATDPRFVNNVARQENASDLEAYILEWTVPRSKAEIIAKARHFRVIGAPVSTIPEVLRHPHLLQRQYFRTALGIAGREITVPGPPFRIHTSPDLGWTIRTPAPELGADTARILRSVGGMSYEDVAELVSAGAAMDAEASEGVTQ